MLISLVDSLRRIFVIKPVVPYSCCFKYFMKIVDCHNWFYAPSKFAYYTWTAFKMQASRRWQVFVIIGRLQQLLLSLVLNWV